MKSYYTQDWLSIKSRHAWVIVPLLAVLIVLSNWLEINCACSQIGITQSIETGGHTILILSAFLLKKILSFVMNYFKSSFTHRLVARLNRSAMKLFFDEYINLRYASFRVRCIGSIHHAINKRAAALTELLTAVFIRLLSDLCFLAFVSDLIKKELNWAALIKICTIIILFLIFSIFAHRKRAVLRKMINEAFEKNTSLNLDILMNYERIKAFDNVQMELGKYYRVMHDQVYYKSIYEATYEMLSFVNQLILLLMTYFIFQEYNMQAGTRENIMLFILILTKLRDTVYGISSDIDNIFISYCNLSVTDLKKSDYEDVNGGVQMVQFQRDIVVEGLGFSYNGAPVLKGVTCTIQKGEKVAIAGSTGSGKSTFLKLLMGLYEDYEGSIKIDGVEMRDINRNSVLRLTAFVPQQTYLFNRSILSNLLDGNPGLTSRQIVHYAEQSGYDGQFSELGYDKAVGERGCSLSGGQRQKLCLTRAIVSDRPIVMLDRACASMDTASEAEVTRLVRTLMKNQTVLSIVDSISSLAAYDKILYFENYTILEQGSFSALMGNNGGFYRFYNDSI